MKNIFRIKNIKIRTKILLLVTLICFFALISISVAAYSTIKNLSDYSLQANKVLIDSATNDAGEALIKQTNQMLLTIAREQSRSCNTILSDIKFNVNLLEGSVKDIFSNPDYYAHNRPITRPEEVMPGVYASTYTMPQNMEMTPEVQSEMRMLSNLDALMPSLALNRSILKLYVGMPSGLSYNFTNSMNEIPDYDPRTRPWYIEASTHPEYVIFTDVYEDDQTGELILTCAKAVIDDNKKLIGVAALDLQIESLKQLILGTRIMNQGYVFIMDNNGRYIVHPDLGKEGFNPYPLDVNSGQKVPFETGYRVMMSGTEGFVSSDIAGKRWFLTYSPIAATGWSVGVIVAEEEILSSLQMLTNQMDILSEESQINIRSMSARAIYMFVGIFVLIIIMVGILSYILTHIVSRPIQNLALESAKITKDNLRYRIPVESRDEIGILTEAFNNMADNLYEYTQHIIDLMQAKDELEAVAYTDTLTGLFNRRYFTEFALIQLNRIARQGGNAFVIMLDIDFFKKVNDTYGHQIGDEVLKYITVCVKNTIRSYDLFARYGGEEFILLITDTPKDEVWYLVERIRVNICKQPIAIDELSIPVSASFGVAEVEPLEELNNAIDLADKAMYQAKNTGRNRSVFYGEDYHLR